MTDTTLDALLEAVRYLLKTVEESGLPARANEWDEMFKKIDALIKQRERPRMSEPREQEMRQ